jgi:hypothetical protein
MAKHITGEHTELFYDDLLGYYSVNKSSALVTKKVATPKERLNLREQHGLHTLQLLGSAFVALSLGALVYMLNMPYFFGNILLVVASLFMFLGVVASSTVKLIKLPEIEQD